jgi:acetyl-CoA carboxylase beta subunit
MISSSQMNKKNGTISLVIKCPNCGKPINKTSLEFGMDCEDKCAEKTYRKLVEANTGAKTFDSFLNKIQSPDTFADCNDEKEKVFNKALELLTAIMPK